MRYPIAPVAKPRMTQRDKWAKRPAVQRYWDFKDACACFGVHVPEAGAHVTFIVPMPKSWSKKKRLKMLNKPHTSRPDLDNYLKALLDAVYGEDSGVWDIRATKLWGVEGAIQVWDVAGAEKRLEVRRKTKEV